MKVPVSWLRELVDIDVPAEELAQKLTMAGLEVGEVITIGGWENCFVGYVEKVEPHPNADRLTLCTVSTGNGTQRVVCGAPNVAAGQKIAFAQVGARLIDAHSGKPSALKAAKIRGVVSEGMVCSQRELGLGDEHDGILVLPADAPLGMPLNDYMGDEILDLEPTPNRVDWLSLLGVAYEVAALTGAKMHLPEVAYPEEGMPISGQASVNIIAPDLCPRYTASLIKGVVVGPSPRWLQERLIRADMRPINNVVDVTNYVMMEYGQPLHAFDYETLMLRRIRVRRAYTGEVMETLDGVARNLTSENLVIADDRDARALAGVIGSIDSEITEGTTDVFLESASFNPTNNRQSAQYFQLRTEATVRFEKGLRPELAEVALRRATHLIQLVAGGTVARGILDEYPGQGNQGPLRLTQGRIKQVLGVEIGLGKVSEVLTSLGFGCKEAGDGTLEVKVPYWRSDVSMEDDLVEEAARIIGYDDIPAIMLSTPIPGHEAQPMREFREEVRDLLVREGLQEVISYSAVGLEALKRARVGEGEGFLLEVANPMSIDFQYMRPTLRASLLRTLATNLSHQRGSVSIFEIGRVYLPRAGELPLEVETAAGVSYGPRGDEGWLDSGDGGDFYSVKGVVEALLIKLGVDGEFEPLEDSFFHPGKAAALTINGSRVGALGEVHPVVTEAFEVDGAAVYFEINLMKLLEVLPERGRGVKPLARYPASLRDLSLLVDREVPAARVLSIIESQALVDRAVLFDAYEGEGVPPGKSSLAYRLHFQSPSKTLSSEEVGKALDKVVRALQRDVGAVLRGGEVEAVS
jgi:phenylalanyl-tRNA synthetase beta chain